MVDGQTLSFEHARFLHQRSFVMYDRQTGSLWIHTTGRAQIGAHEGKILDFVPSTVTTWKTWRGAHPNTLVLNVKKGRNPRFELHGKLQDGGLSVGQPDVALKFYPFSVLQKQRLVHDKLSNQSIVIVFDPDSFAFAAFEAGDRMFRWENGKLVDATGRAWDAVTGNSGKETLKAVPVVPWLTQAWRRFYPEGEIYQRE